MYSSLIPKGVTKEDIKNLEKLKGEINKKFLESKEKLGFIRSFYDTEVVEEIETFITGIDKNINSIVVIGIGGSDLGTRAVHSAINGNYYNEVKDQKQRKLYFTGDTTDPMPLYDLLQVIDLTKTLFVIVSKSGSTIEPAITTEVILNELARLKLEINKHCVMLTDSRASSARNLATKHNIQIFSIPEDVGGRFSILTVCGLLPLALVGININQLLSGAQSIVKKLDNDNNDSLEFSMINLLYMQKGYNINILMPYIYSFFNFGQWFRQLWAESLGKKNAFGNNQGSISTPVISIGPTDQHSQLQLYSDGPNDKTFTFLTTRKTKNDIIIPRSEFHEYLSGKSLFSILQFELEATERSLTLEGKPTMRITLDDNSPFSIGELIAFYETSIVYLGYLLNINVFDQPGVEMSKNIIYGLVGKRGFEKYSIIKN